MKAETRAEASQKIASFLSNERKGAEKPLYFKLFYEIKELQRELECFGLSAEESVEDVVDEILDEAEAHAETHRISSKYILQVHDRPSVCVRWTLAGLGDINDYAHSLVIDAVDLRCPANRGEPAVSMQAFLDGVPDSARRPAKVRGVHGDLRKTDEAITAALFHDVGGVEAKIESYTFEPDDTSTIVGMALLATDDHGEICPGTSYVLRVKNTELSFRFTSRIEEEEEKN